MSDEEDAPSASNEEAVEGADDAGSLEDASAADSFSPWDEVREAFGEARPLEVVTERGLPTVRVPEGTDAHAPALTREDFTCLEDTRTFVLRGPWREISASFERPEVERASDGRWRVKTDVVVERMKLALARARKSIAERNPTGEQPTEKDALFSVLTSWRLQNLVQAGTAQAIVALTGAQLSAYHVVDPDWVEVEPVRPQCRHFVLQLLPPGETEKSVLEFGYLKRYCSMRRTVAGAFLELTNDAIRACSMRDPVDEKSLRLMHDFDEKKIGQSKDRRYLPLFGATIPGGDGGGPGGDGAVDGGHTSA